MGTNIVITMAGRGSRFFDAGYTVPKYEIEAHGRSLFDWSLLSLRNFIKDDSRLIFVTLAANHSSDYIGHRCRALGLNNFHVRELPAVTDGQATTAFESRDLWVDSEPLLIYNIDTFVVPEALQPSAISAGSEGWVPCFSVPGDHWSFVELSADGWATRVTEKLRISDHASIGLYWFARASSFLTAYQVFFSRRDSLVKGEKYVAPLYNHLIGQGQRISIANVPVEAVHVLGTPAELTEFLNKEPPNV